MGDMGESGAPSFCTETSGLNIATETVANSCFGSYEVVLSLKLRTEST